MPHIKFLPTLPARQASLALRAPLCALLVGFIACTRHDPPSKTSAPNTSLTTSAPTSGGVASSGVAVRSASPMNSEPARQGPRPKPQSAEECRRTCNGEWSAHGLVGVVSCLCRTNDSGKDCRDKAECQGECLLDPVRREVVKPGPPALGYFVGKCSEFVTMFGCTRRIHAGAKGGGPVDLSEPPPEICLD